MIRQAGVKLTNPTGKLGCQQGTASPLKREGRRSSDDPEALVAILLYLRVSATTAVVCNIWWKTNWQPAVGETVQGKEGEQGDENVSFIMSCPVS